MVNRVFEWFGSGEWVEWRATVTTLGGLIALVVASRTYALNSRNNAKSRQDWSIRHRCRYDGSLKARGLSSPSMTIFMQRST